MVRKDKTIVIRLRKQGKSYNEINRLLGVPKSTLSGWLSGVEISSEAKRKLWSEARIKWAKNFIAYNKKRSKVALENAQLAQRIASMEVGSLNKRELLLIGTALYWAEGSMRRRWCFDFSNSDPTIIKVIMKFLREVCKIQEDKFRAWIQVHANISDKNAKLYWSEVSRIPLKQFGKTQTSISKSSKCRRPFNRLPYGTIHIRVADVELVNKIKGWVLGLSRIF